MYCLSSSVILIVHSIPEPGRYNMLEHIQHFIHNFQGIAMSKGLYNVCFSRLSVRALLEFHHCTIQVYVYTDPHKPSSYLSTRYHESIYT